MVVRILVDDHKLCLRVAKNIVVVFEVKRSFSSWNSGCNDESL